MPAPCHGTAGPANVTVQCQILQSADRAAQPVDATTTPSPISPSVSSWSAVLEEEVGKCFLNRRREDLARRVGQLQHRRMPVGPPKVGCDVPPSGWSWTPGVLVAEGEMRCGIGNGDPTPALRSCSSHSGAVRAPKAADNSTSRSVRCSRRRGPVANRSSFSRTSRFTRWKSRATESSIGGQHHPAGLGVSVGHGGGSARGAFVEAMGGLMPSCLWSTTGRAGLPS